MRRLKRDDMVIFTKNYKDSVQKGEARPIDKAVYIDDKLSGVYIKLDHTWIYLNDTNFNEYCELKPKSFCKIGEDYKKSCDAIDKKLLKETIEQMKKSMLVKEYDFEQEVINEIDRKSQIIDKEMEKIKNYDHINPNHYKQGSKEVIEMMQDIWGKEKLIAYCEMNAFKYRMRAGLKPEQSVQRDLDKAKWYENKAIQLRNEQK